MSTQAYYSSGWCGSCGRKRGPDGRCENCDPWWSSPLIQYGAPLVIGVTLLIFLGTSLARQSSREGVGSGTPHVVSAPAPRVVGSGGGRSYAPNPGGFTGPGGFAPPVSAYVPAPASTSSFSASGGGGSYGPSIPILTVRPEDLNRPTPAQVAMMRQEELRRTTAAVDAAIRADDYAREAGASRVATSAYGGIARQPMAASMNAAF